METQTFENCTDCINTYYHHLKHENDEDCKICRFDEDDKIEMYGSFLEAAKKMFMYYCIFHEFDFENKLRMLQIGGEFKKPRYDNYYIFGIQCAKIQKLAHKRSYGETTIDEIIACLSPLIDHQKFHEEIIVILESSVKNNSFNLFLNECEKVDDIRYGNDTIFKLTFDALKKYDLNYDNWIVFIEHVVQLNSLYRLIRVDNIITGYEIVEYINTKSAR